MALEALNPFGSWIHRRLQKGNDELRVALQQTRLMVQILMHPSAPWAAKLVAGCSVGYIFSPIQLIPTFIPVIGQLDDLLVLFIGFKLVRKLTPESILSECMERTASREFTASTLDTQVARHEQRPQAA